MRHSSYHLGVKLEESRPVPGDRSATLREGGTISEAGRNRRSHSSWSVGEWFLPRCAFATVCSLVIKTFAIMEIPTSDDKIYKILREGQVHGM